MISVAALANVMPPPGFVAAHGSHNINFANLKVSMAEKLDKIVEDTKSLRERMDDRLGALDETLLRRSMQTRTI